MLTKIVYALALLGYAAASVHHYKTGGSGGHQGHDGNLFDDAASVLDNFFG